MDSGYWRSIDGIRHRHRSRVHRGLRASVEQEPEQKTRRNAHRSDSFRFAVQHDVIGRFAEGWPRAHLALTLNFATTRPQPPAIERLAKHYIDLLKASEADGAKRWGLFHDDRQIKMLSVTSCVAGGDAPRPRIDLHCLTRADAIAELEAVECLTTEHGCELDNGDDRLSDDLWLELALDDLRYIERRADPASVETARCLRATIHRRRQEELLRGNDAFMRSLLHGRARELFTGHLDAATRRARDLAVNSRSLADTLEGLRQSQHMLDRMREWFQVSLPPLPMAHGEGSDFRQRVREACDDYFARRPMLQPVVVPLRVTILVVPPKQKDLDNIALDVIPAIRAAASARAGGAEPTADVASYQVLELHRGTHHRSEGELAVVLGHGHNFLSYWEAAADDVERCVEDDRRW